MQMKMSKHQETMELHTSLPKLTFVIYTVFDTPAQLALPLTAKDQHQLICVLAAPNLQKH